MRADEFSQFDAGCELGKSRRINVRANFEALLQRAGLVGHDDEKLKLGGGGGGGHGADKVLCGGGDARGHLQQGAGRYLK